MHFCKRLQCIKNITRKVEIENLLESLEMKRDLEELKEVKEELNELKDLLRELLSKQTT